LFPVRFLLRDIFVRPIQDHIGDVEMIRPEHHHVRRTLEYRIFELVELDVFRLRGPVARSAPRVDPRLLQALPLSGRVPRSFLQSAVGSVSYRA
jgi:hypothetical protein